MEESIETPVGTEETAISSPEVTQEPSTGSEAVTNTEEADNSKSPTGNVSTALRQTRDELKTTREELAAIKADQERLQSTLTPPAPADDLDPDVAKTLDSYMTRNGYVKKADLEAESAATRATIDLAEIKTAHKLSDAEMTDLRSHAVKLGAKDKAGLEAAYRDLYFDKIIEDRVKAALTKAGAPTATAEAPTAGGAKTPAAEAPVVGTTLMGRIKAATAKQAQ